MDRRHRGLAAKHARPEAVPDRTFLSLIESILSLSLTQSSLTMPMLVGRGLGHV